MVFDKSPDHAELKEVCNGGVACSLLNASLEVCRKLLQLLYFTLVCTQAVLFCRKNHTTRAFAFIGDSPFFYMKETKKFYDAKLIF